MTGPIFRPEYRPEAFTAGGHRIDFRTHVGVMAIVNRTPDSFYDKGATFALDKAVAAVVAAQQAGADWVDIGGVPFGPGEEVTAAAEADRVLPLVERARSDTDLIISVETTRAEVAALVLDAGAHVVNDTSGLHDPEMAATVAAHGGGLVLTHSVMPPRVAVGRAHYDDVVAEVRDFLADRVQRVLAAGVDPGRIVIDPGHDLNKNTAHSLELTRRLSEIASLGYPLLAALSNKDFIGESLDLPVGDRLAGSLASAVFCVTRGARILRVHDVVQTVRAVRMVEAIMGWRQPVDPVHNMGL